MAEMEPNRKRRRTLSIQMANSLLDTVPALARLAQLDAEGLEAAGEIVDDTLDEVEHGVPRTRLKVGRNEPCPCRSGKKFKRCCAAAG